MPITEPTTILTDYALAVIISYAGYVLWKRSRRKGLRSQTLWSLGFACIAAAALVGGTFHALFQMMPSYNLNALWNATVFLIGAAAGFMIAAALVSDIRSGHAGTRLLWWGVAISLGSLAVLPAGPDLHRHFNRYDLYHVVQAVGLICLFRGARRLPGP